MFVFFLQSTFTDSEVVYDVSGFKHFLSESEFTLDSGEKVSLNAGQVDKVWAKCRSERKSISRGNFVTKGTHHKSLVYYEPPPPPPLPTPISLLIIRTIIGWAVRSKPIKIGSHNGIIRVFEVDRGIRGGRLYAH